MKMKQIKSIAVVSLMLALVSGCGPAAETDYQLHRASVNMAKAYRQFQKADNAMVDENENAALNHLSSGLDFFQKAEDHLAKAEEDAYTLAGNEIDKGNAELQKSIDAYNSGNDDKAASHYSTALNHYDKAMEIME